MQHGRAKDYLVERILRVLARGPASGEERLQRLRGELDHPVVLDAPRPASLQAEVTGREHAELHSRGSVCTTTSTISGRSRRIASSMRLACSCAADRSFEPQSLCVSWAESTATV